MVNERRRVAILGSTGSIGTQALEAIDVLNRDERLGVRFDVVALVAGRNRGLLDRQAAHWTPDVALCAAEAGAEALVEVASRDDVDIVVHAVVGAAGLAASFAAAGAGKRLCLANKESLVVGGDLLMATAEAGGALLLPIDSEHSAIFQAASCGRRQDVDRIILTASGGPFRDASLWPAERLAAATVDEALAHPTWTMGGKITVDSATLFNKGLELIEAVRLFGMPQDRIDVVVHPQSVVHSMVQFRDASTLAHLSPPDMRLPIAYALTHPRRGPSGARACDWSRAQSLDFEPPDPVRFPALSLAREAADRAGLVPAWLNAANEVAVAAFLDRELPFGDIAKVVARAVEAAPSDEPRDLNDLVQADAEARAFARS